MVIRPNRPRTIISEKEEYQKMFNKSKSLQSNSDLFKHRKFLTYSLIFGVFGLMLSKFFTNTIFVKKSNTEEIVQYKSIENSNKIKEYQWMTKLLYYKSDYKS